MSTATRVLAVSALVVGLCPALAFACDEDQESTVTVTVGDGKCTAKVINTLRAHRSVWEPGHLIEPDSMKLGPGDDLKAPETEQWVIISSRSGVIRIHRFPWSGKKTEGRTLQQYGPFRS
jgi:hypothetical protein